MKNIVSILVYNRLRNLQHWLKCWDKTDKEGSELVVIQNTDSGAIDVDYKILCDSHGVKYFARINQGYDVGAFQDVCKGRIAGFPSFENLLWATDDVFPMSTNFVKEMAFCMRTGIGVVAMEISNYVKPHIRTSAFMINRELTGKLVFPADPVMKKRQCYEFEHMSDNTFFDQVNRTELKAIMAAPPDRSPLWDTGYLRRLPRQKEHELIFGPCPMPERMIPKRVHLLNDK